MESRTQGSRPRSRTQKIRGQGQGLTFRGQTISRPITKDTKRKCSRKKRSSSKKLANFPRNFRRSPKKRSSRKKSRILRSISGEEKKGHAFSPFLTNQKIVLSSTEEKVFSGLVGFEAKTKDLTFEEKAKDFKMCPRGQSVLENSTSSK